MSTLVHCITKAGKLLSKSDVKMLRNAHTKYLNAGMSTVEATQRSVEDFVIAAHDKVTGYENEAKSRGGDISGDVFSLKEAMAVAKKGSAQEPRAPRAEAAEPSLDKERDYAELRKIAAGQIGFDWVYDDSIAEVIKAAGHGDIDLGLKGPEITRDKAISKAAVILGLKSEAATTKAESAELDQATAEIVKEVDAGTLNLDKTEVEQLGRDAKSAGVTPLGLKMVAHKQSGYIGQRNNDENFNAEEQELVDRAFAGKPPAMPIETAMADTFTNAKTKLRQTLVDQFASFRSILKDPTSWMLSHLTASSTEALVSTITEGRPFLDSEGVIGVDTSEKSMSEILEPLGDLLNRWTYWMAGNRAEMLMAQDKEHLFTKKDIKTMKNMNRGNEKLFNDVRKEFEAINDAVVQVGVDTGLISAEEARQWKEEGFYLPFYRVLEAGAARGPRAIGNAGLVRQQAYKKLKGGTQQLDNLVANAALNWNHLLGASLKNQAGLKAIDTAVKLGMAERVTKEQASKQAIYLRRDGKEVWYEVSEPLVLDSLNSLNWEGLNSRTMKIGRAFKRALTTGVTASPEFKIANLIRDSVSALAVTDISTNIAKNLSQGWDATKVGSPTEVAMRTGGATFGQSGYIHGSDPAAALKLVEKGIKPKTVLSETADFVNVWKHYQDLGARLENVNRAADYVQSLARGEGTLKATFGARDHLDFTRTGSATWVRAMSQLVPFLNARLQGIDKLARSAPGTIKEFLDPREAAKFKVVIGRYALASIGMYLAIKDNDDYDQLEEWEKRTYHHFEIPFVEGLFRIPRPFEVGAIGYMAESVVHSMVDDSAHGELFAERMVSTLTETFSFNPVPQVIKPAIELGFNKNFFTGRAIESEYMHISDLSPVRRKRVWTSETAIGISKAMDKILWDKVVLSPIQVEHLVQGYLGWAGATSLAAADMLITRPLTDAPTQPPTKLSEYPVIKRLMTTLPIKNTKYISNFYDNLKEINNAYTDMRDAKKRGEYDEVERLLIEKGSLLRLRGFYTAQQKRLAKINQRMNVVKASSMGAEAKGRELDRLTLFKNQLTKQIHEKTETLKKIREAKH